jgi:hypothetical protein
MRQNPNTTLAASNECRVPMKMSLGKPGSSYKRHVVTRNEMQRAVTGT